MKIVTLDHILDDKKHRPYNPWDTRVIVVHRVWFDDWPLDREYNVVELFSRFIHDPLVNRGVGKNIPYKFAVDRDGTIYRLLPWEEKGAHARSWNEEAIGVAAIGDFRKETMSYYQESNLIDLCAELCAAHYIPPQAVYGAHKVITGLFGHDELPGASKDKDKRCPAIDMDEFRESVRIIKAAAAQQRLLNAEAAA